MSFQYIPPRVAPVPSAWFWHVEGFEHSILSALVSVVMGCFNVCCLEFPVAFKKADGEIDQDD